MRVSAIIESLLSPCTESVHSKTVSAVARFCRALLNGQRLGVTALGRAAPGRTKAKHRIKAADRLVSSRRLHRSIPTLYRALACRWLGGANTTAVMLVDWTGLRNGFHCLSAAVAFQGRSIPLYAEVHPEDKLANRRIEANFLKVLKTMVPPQCRVIVVTDAGFYTEWCDVVEKLGWQFVARIRNKTMYRSDTAHAWTPVKALYPTVTAKARSLGWVWLTKTKPRQRRLICIKKRSSIRRGPSRGRSTTANKHRKAAKEPWILATSLNAAPHLVVAIYAQRMQIEQNYRDLKDARWGWGLDQSRSRSADRFAVLVLLATIASFIVLLAGLEAEHQRLHLDHQANTVRNRRVLSLFFVGNRLLREATPFDLGPLRHAFARLRAHCFSPGA